MLPPAPWPRPGLPPLLSGQNDPGPPILPRHTRRLPPVREIVVVIVVIIIVVGVVVVIVVVVVAPVVGGGPGVVVVVVSVVGVVVSDVVERWELVADLPQEPVLLPDGSSYDSTLKRSNLFNPFNVRIFT